MRRRKRRENSHFDETWLIPYADMLTLLLALFVVLFAASTVDSNKFEQLTQTLSQAFMGGESILDYSSTVPPVVLPEQDLDERGREQEVEDESGQELTPEEQRRLESLNDLEEIQKIIDAYIRDNNLEMSLTTNLTEDGLMITILDHALFDPGQATIKSEAEEIALELAEILDTDPPQHMTIAGHTDNVPMRTAQFPSNWELSTARAINFMKILLEHDNLEAHRFSVTGYGEHRPAASNDTVEGRSLNRRVEVLILPRYLITENDTTN